VSAWIVFGCALIAVLASLRVTITDPRVHIRWREDLGAAERATLERRYQLHAGDPIEGTTATWRYELGDLSRKNVQTLLDDPAVDDTAYIDRDTMTTDGRSIHVTTWHPFSGLFERPAQLLELHRSLWLLLAGAVLLSAARVARPSQRRNIAMATLLVVGLAAVRFPFDPLTVRMGGSNDHTRSRHDFEDWFTGRVRFEKHLSQVMLAEVYRRSGPDEAAPERAVIVLSRFGTAWFVLSALAIACLDQWSALALRYIGLTLLAPSALLYFGWREFGYLSLSVAAFPLLARGLREGGGRLETGSVFAGLGAALHGSGLVSLAGAGMAALGAAGRPTERIERVLRVTAWGTAAYLGWIAIYVIVLKLPVSPDSGAAAINSWRPWTLDEMREGRRAAAILSATGARDLLMTAWVIGAPLLPVAVSLWRKWPQEVRTMLWYLPPSLAFVMLRWPFEGVGGGIDLVVAGFPALYALAWICAHDAKRTNIAAALLVSAHYGFWRVVFDHSFRP
jgi:hypothetical protein